MEKLQKYCLSVILVIIYSNVSANMTTETAENIGCKKLYELYSKFLSEDVEDSIVLSGLNTENKYFVLNHKYKAIDVFGKKNQVIQWKYKEDFTSDYSNHAKFDKTLANFDKQSKHSDFAINIYLKNKAAKIRNKDDLDLKNKT